MRERSSANIERTVERLRQDHRLEMEWTEVARFIRECFMAPRQNQPGMPYTARHSSEVGFLMFVLASEMIEDNKLPARFPEPRALGLIAGLLHDIGKYFLPRGLMGIGHNMPIRIGKVPVWPGRLPTAIEIEAIRLGHLQAGLEFMGHITFPHGPLIGRLVACHHTHFDGRDYPRSVSYPKGHSGQELSLEENMLKVCDLVSALFPRFYRKNGENKVERLEDAIGIVLGVAGREVHPELTAYLVRGLYRVSHAQAVELVESARALQEHHDPWKQVHGAIRRLPLFIQCIRPDNRTRLAAYHRELTAESDLEKDLVLAQGIFRAYDYSGPLFPEPP